MSVVFNKQPELRTTMYSVLPWHLIGWLFPQPQSFSFPEEPTSPPPWSQPSLFITIKTWESLARFQPYLHFDVSSLSSQILLNYSLFAFGAGVFFV